VAFINAIQAESAFRRGELFYTGNWLNTLKKKTLENVNLYSQYELQTFVRLLAAREEAVNIRELIRPGWDAAMRQGRGRDAIACEVVLAKSLYIRGEPLPAMKILERALFKAEPGHFVRTFLDEGGVLISMIKQVLASRSNKKLNPDDCSQQYLYLLLDEMAKDALKASTNHPQPGAVGLEPLTDHELRILRLLESGYSNKQIAGELSISVNTVKYHLKNIYGKLGVVNRTQASRLMRKEK
jgi:LuxR family maltose regulon positive regulatory protein